jgi:hypothetical protein
MTDRHHIAGFVLGLFLAGVFALFVGNIAQGTVTCAREKAAQCPEMFI